MEKTQVPQATVVDVGEALIREYLNRKGFHNTLASFESERKSTFEPFSTRKALSDALFISEEMRENKRRCFFSFFIYLFYFFRFQYSSCYSFHSPSIQHHSRSFDFKLSTFTFV